MIVRPIIMALILVAASTSAQAKDNIAIIIQHAYLQFLPREMVAPKCESYVLQGNKFISCTPAAGLWLVRDSTVYAVNGSALGYLEKMRSIYSDFSRLPPLLKTAMPDVIFTVIESGITPSEPLVWNISEDTYNQSDEDKYCKYQREKEKILNDTNKQLGPNPSSSDYQAYESYDKQRSSWIEARLEELAVTIYGSKENHYESRLRFIDSGAECS